MDEPKPPPVIASSGDASNRRVVRWIVWPALALLAFATWVAYFTAANGQWPPFLTVALLGMLVLGPPVLGVLAVGLFVAALCTKKERRRKRTRLFVAAAGALLASLTILAFVLVFLVRHPLLTR